MSRLVITPIFKASFVKLFAPSTNDRDQHIYQITGIFEKDADFSEMKAICHEALLKEWGSADRIPPYYRSPFRRGEWKTNEYPLGYDLGKHPYYEGKIIVAMNSINFQPGVSYADKTPLTNRNEVYSGMIARASVKAFAYGATPKLDPKTGRPISMTPGVSFSLQNVQKIRDAEPLGAVRSKPEDDFEAFIEPTAAGNNSDLLGATAFDSLGI